MIDWFDQGMINSAHVAVIGAGAIGNEVIKNLALLGIGHIDVFDFDRIEVHNLTRSVLFKEIDVGRNKAEVAAERAADLDPQCKISSFVGDFWELMSFDDIKKYQVVFCCVDNFEARIRCNTLCYLLGVDLVISGIDSRFASVEFYPFSFTVDGGCYECNLPDSVYARISQRYSCGWLKKASFVERKVPTTIITSAVAGALAVSVGLRLKMEAEVQSAKLLCDTITGSSNRVQSGVNELCPCCSRLPRKPLAMAASPHISSLVDWPGAGKEISITTSDQILVSYKVGDEEEVVVWERATKYDDSFPSTVSDEPDRVVLDIRDTFSLSELAHRFSGRSMPCKFVVVDGAKPLVLEMKGGA